MTFELRLQCNLVSPRTDGMTRVPAREFRGDVERQLLPTLHHSRWNSIVAFTSLALTMAHLLRLFVRKFQPILAIGVMRAALLRLLSYVHAEIQEADNLLVANEDIVFDFVAATLEVPGESPHATEWSSARSAICLQQCSSFSCGASHVDALVEHYPGGSVFGCVSEQLLDSFVD